MQESLDPALITGLLHRWSLGEEKAVEKLLPLVYEELRAIARSYMSRERPWHTLGVSGLVHETFLRLWTEAPHSWQDRRHFYGIAARLMRQVLVDYSRRQRARKRQAEPAAANPEGSSIP